MSTSPVIPVAQANTDLPPEQWWQLGALSRRLAKRYCKQRGDQSCDWYHGLRPYWRALGLLADPSKHQGYFESALTPLADSGEYDSVLVSGTADFAMPALVAQTWSRIGRTSKITILDTCATPLLVCRWYLRQFEQPFANVLSDVRTHCPEHPYDLVVSHSFFPQFPPAQRAQVMSAWHNLLRPGGKVITVTRVRAEGIEESGFIRLQGVEQDAFIDRLRYKLISAKVDVPVAESELIAWARHYVASRRNYTVRDPDGLIKQMQDQGFSVAAQEIDSGRSLQEEWRQDGARPGGITYLAINATRLS